MATALRPITDASDLQDLVKREIENASDFVEHELGPQRAESQRYYDGEKFGNEELGRSQVVWRIVRDAVREIKPSLVRIFFGSENAVEYTPNVMPGADPEEVQREVAAAEQATDLARHIVLQDNPGVSIFSDVFDDSLFQIAGIVKLWVDDSIDVVYPSFSGLDDAAVGLMQAEGGEIIEIETDERGFHSGVVRRVDDVKRIKFAAVPGEEFLINRRARDWQDVTYCGHRTMKTVADLVALGIPLDVIETNISASDYIDGESERGREALLDDDSNNPATQRVLYVESYMRIDLDGDGIHELRKIVTLGEGYEIVANEPVDMMPFATFCPFPRAHQFFGDDVADMTKDLQLIQSALVRLVMDSAAFAIHNRTVYNENTVDREEVENSEVGASIAARDARNDVVPLTHNFMGNQLLPVLELVKDEVANRVGAQGAALDPNALQSTTKLAVAEQRDARVQTLELIARLYAEGGMKRFYKLLLKLMVAHQNQPRTIKVRGNWVATDPRAWVATMDVSVNVGLGMGLAEDRLASLRELGQYQQQIMQAFGPNNPAVTLGHVTNTMSKIAELSGWADTSQFVNKLPLDFQMPTPPPQPDPAQILADVEVQKTQSEMVIDAMRLALDRDKLLADTLLKAAEIRQKGGDVDIEQIRQTLEADEIV